MSLQQDKRHVVISTPCNNSWPNTLSPDAFYHLKMYRNAFAAGMQLRPGLYWEAYGAHQTPSWIWGKWDNRRREGTDGERREGEGDGTKGKAPTGVKSFTKMSSALADARCPVPTMIYYHWSIVWSTMLRWIMKSAHNAQQPAVFWGKQHALGQKRRLI